MRLHQRFGRQASGWAAMLVAAGTWIASSSAQAESGPLNLHLELGAGLPVLGPYAPPSSDDGHSRFGGAGWASLDWKIKGALAPEMIFGAGYFAELSDVPDPGSDYWQFGLGVRSRLLDDHGGYADDRGGNRRGNLWVSGHVGYHHFDGVQLGLDAATGYEWSLRRPWQVGVFTRTVVLFGGDIHGVDAACFAGLSASLELRPRSGSIPGDENRNAPEWHRDSDLDGLSDALESRTGTDPFESDTDADGLPDGAEDASRNGKVDAGETNPRKSDTDGGGIPDGDEAMSGKDPLDPADDDTDKDGVSELIDQCPDTAPRAKVNAAGCSELTSRAALEFPGIQFTKGSSTLLAESDKALNVALEVLKASPDANVEIGGHTDSKGSTATNLRLSRRRAEVVKKWLVEHGVDASRLRVHGYGSSTPVASNDTDEGRARNRRIEFRRLEAVSPPAPKSPMAPPSR